MIDLSQSVDASPQLHVVPTDPGTSWIKDTAPAIDIPPDEEIDPLPEAQWPADAKREGVYGAVCPRVIAQPGGGYRMYYTQIMPRPGFPMGALDYGNATTRILSAASRDGRTWTPEPGVRLSAEQGGAGEFRVVSCEVAPVPGESGQLRMYYECCAGSQDTVNAIRSAVSDDGGIEWSVEPGARLEVDGCNCNSPRIMFLDDGRCRLYVSVRGRGIVSAVSRDGGVTFAPEPGERIQPDSPHDAHVAFACDIVTPAGGGWVMVYAGYSHAKRADVLRATSDDGLNWQKEVGPVISPDGTGCDAVKCSEPSVYRLPDDAGRPPRYGLGYEACDGVGPDLRGAWRIAAATSASS